MGRIYADNAASVPMCEAAREAYLDALDRFGNPSSLHAEGAAAARLLAECRESVAASLGASPEEIVFTSGGTESDNAAILSMWERGKREGRRKLVSTAIEHHAVLCALERARRDGAVIEFCPVDGEGRVDLEALASLVDGDTAGVSIMYANNEIGTTEPIEETAAICRERGVPFHTDAVQAVGQLAVDVRRNGVDMLSLSAHKFAGPRGVGALYVRGGLSFEPLLCGGAQERMRRAGTENAPAVAGTAAALSLALSEREERASRAAALRDRLIAGIGAIPGCTLTGSAGHRLPGLASFVIDGVSGESLVIALDLAGIAASSGAACASGSLEPSGVLTAIGFSPERARCALRLSISAANTDAEIDAICSATESAVATIRKTSGNVLADENG